MSFERVLYLITTRIKIIFIQEKDEEISLELIKHASILKIQIERCSLTKVWSDTYYSKLKIFSMVGYCVWKVESIEELYYLFWWPTLALHEIFSWWDLCSLQSLYSHLALYMYHKIILFIYFLYAKHEIWIIYILMSCVVMFVIVRY